MGARLAEVAGGCAARRSQQLTLLAGAAVREAHVAAGWAVSRGLPRPPSLALPSRNAGSASRIWSVFLGQPAPPPAPGPGLGVGATPPGFPGSSLLLPVWLPG